VGAEAARRRSRTPVSARDMGRADLSGPLPLRGCRRRSLAARRLGRPGL